MFKRHWPRILAITFGVLLLTLVASGVFAQDEPLTAETVQTNLNQIWLLVAGFLVFFMQAGFAMLEGGMIRARGVVNSMAENFMDAAITAIVFFIIGYGIAYAPYVSQAAVDAGEAEAAYGSAIFTMPDLALGGIDGTGAEDGFTFIDFFFQFAFAGAAATIATGAMAERTDFRGKLIYSAILGAIIYPIIVFWTWGGGWLAELGFMDFAGSTIVHQTGGVIALMGAAIVGPRVGRVWGSPPAPSNLMMATMGTFILWFGWYGFNVGSTLEATSPNSLGLVAVNTTLAAAAGALSAMLVMYFRSGKWDMPFILNGSLAGLVGITAPCAFVSPFAAIVIGVTAGVVLVVASMAVEAAKIDDAVGAFSVHGANGMLGSLAIGFWGIPALTGNAGGLFISGSFESLGIQAVGVIAVTIFAAVTGIIMFGAIRAAGLLRMPAAAEDHGIDAHEHGSSVMPDLIPLPGDTIEGSDSRSSAPAVGG